jgi:hypothetical protein
MKQATPLTVRETFSFKVNGKGRTITFKKGQDAWVTNTQVDQQTRGVVNVARRGQVFGYDFTREQVEQFFMENL